MKYSVVFAATVSMLAACSAAFAWGPDGHQIVAEIAQQYLSPQARTAVKELLGKQSLAEIATWGDHVRGQKGYEWTAMHVALLTPGANTFKYDRNDRGSCPVTVIYRCTAILQDRAAAHQDRLEALKLLVHFVGDVHQPVHVERRGDKSLGRFDCFGQDVPLHGVWDHGLLDHARKEWKPYSQDLAAKITPAQLKTWSAQQDPCDWVNESWDATVNYVRKVPDGHVITEAYFQRCMPVIEQRLEQGGIRLAGRLNAIFAGEKLPAPASAPAR